MNPLRLFRMIGAYRRRDMEFYPPWWLTGVRLIENRDNWRHVRVLLPLGFFTRNFGGNMFGGSQASLADPIAAIACAHVFPGYAVWTRALSLDFRAVGNSDLELRFDFDPALEAAIREDLERKGRSTPTFELGYYRTDGVLCTHITNTVAIRPKGYKAVQGAYSPTAGDTKPEE
jgi:acyl-coenzyme A thioesterase PaaI-like protein